MSRICYLTGKRTIAGNRVSHSERHVKRTFKVNLMNKTLVYDHTNNGRIRMRISAYGLRLIRKYGSLKMLLLSGCRRLQLHPKVHLLRVKLRNKATLSDIRLANSVRLRSTTLT